MTKGTCNEKECRITESWIIGIAIFVHLTPWKTTLVNSQLDTQNSVFIYIEYIC
jgi:hypothetical protein